MASNDRLLGTDRPQHRHSRVYQESKLQVQHLSGRCDRRASLGSERSEEDSRESRINNTKDQRVVVSNDSRQRLLTFAYGLSRGDAAQVRFSPQAWRRAVDAKSPNWSRRELLSQFYKQYKLDGMARARVIELLAEPAVAYELYPGSDQRERIDIYRLSAKNNESFRVEYNTRDKVSSAFVETHSCKANVFAGAAPVTDKILTLESLEKTLLKKYRSDQIVNLQISQLETLIGKSDKNWSRKSLAGGQMWMNYTYVWRLSPDGGRVFTANGHVPARNWEESGARVHSYAIVSMTPDCLPDLPDS